VVIDAGHGGTDNGAMSARGGMEKNYTIDTAFRLEAILRAAGLKTVLTRHTDVFVDLYERAHIASLYPDYAFVSIHFNSATPEARGLETYALSPRGAASTSSAYLTRSDIQKLPGNNYDAFNILLASMVHSEIIRLNPGDPSADRGVKRARFVVIKQNVLPAILVEGGFVSNRMEAARVNRPEYRQSLAEAIGRGLIRFVNVMGDRRLALPGVTPEDSEPSTPPPRAVPLAPSGLASESSSNGAGTLSHPRLPTSATGITRKKKPKNVDKALEAMKAPATEKSSEGTTGNSLNLSEPAVPTPTPGAEKASSEPDEPPTVNIYSTTPVPSPGETNSTDHPGSSTTNATPAPSSSHNEP